MKKELEVQELQEFRSLLWARSGRVASTSQSLVRIRPVFLENFVRSPIANSLLNS
jgi:hypothetical protein